VAGLKRGLPPALADESSELSGEMRELLSEMSQWLQTLEQRITSCEARMAIFDFIEGWYNPHRRHSVLDYHSPINYERIQQTESLTASPILSTETG
jgi:transposase InsO family protein